MGTLAAAAAVVAILLYIVYNGARDELRFAIGALATAGGIAAAYYIGSGLRASAEADRMTRELKAESDRMTRTLTYPLRFGSPEWIPIKRKVGNLLKSCMNKHESQRLQTISEAVKADPDLDGCLVAVLNFLEELAMAVNLGLVDENILDRYFRTTVLRTFGTVSPWVRNRRDEHEAQRVWQELEQLHAIWLKRASR
jgi:hypothetical protein